MKFLVYLFMLAVFALVAYLIMELWNGMLPQVCGFKPVGYRQSVGLMVMGQLICGKWEFSLNRD